MTALCPACASPALTEITMTMTNGEDVDFVSCRACEHKGWSRQGRVVELDRVLSMAAKKKP